jgi:hypothetical protein
MAGNFLRKGDKVLQPQHHQQPSDNSAVQVLSSGCLADADQLQVAPAQLKTGTCWMPVMLPTHRNTLLWSNPGRWNVSVARDGQWVSRGPSTIGLGTQALSSAGHQRV